MSCHKHDPADGPIFDHCLELQMGHLTCMWVLVCSVGWIVGGISLHSYPTNFHPKWNAVFRRVCIHVRSPC